MPVEQIIVNGELVSQQQLDDAAARWRWQMWEIAMTNTNEPYQKTRFELHGVTIDDTDNQGDPRH